MRRRHHLSLADALYVELAARLDTVVVTTDHRLSRATPLAVAPPA
jgi:predicted nucleic acid-binding protein